MLDSPKEGVYLSAAGKVHINVTTAGINKWGPTMYDWEGIHNPGMKNLGMDFKNVGYCGPHPEKWQFRNDVDKLAKQSIDSGKWTFRLRYLD